MSELDGLSRRQLYAVITAQAETIDAQAARIAELMATVESLTQQVVSLTAQVAELTAKLAQNSGNSSLPPSSDRFVKPTRDRRGPTSRSLRIPERRPSGGRPCVDPERLGLEMCRVELLYSAHNTVSTGRVARW